MRIDSVRIGAFKGLDIKLPWPSAIVLFGPNDSGKSNILEGFMLQLGPERTVRTPPQLPEDLGSLDSSDQAIVDVEVQLDGLDVENHPDQEIFLAWLLSPNVHWIEPELKGEEKRLWADLKLEYERLEEAADRSQAVASLVDRVRRAVLEIVDRRRSSFEDTDRSGSEAVDGSALSRKFVVSNGGLFWRSLSVADGDRSDTYIAAFELDPARGCSIRSFLDHLHLRVVCVEDGEEAKAALQDRLERLLERLSEDDGSGVANGDGLALLFGEQRVANDPWVERGEGNATTLRPIIGEACESLSARINELAPAFVSRSYEVSLRPLYPDQWRAYGGRRVAVTVRPRSRHGGLDLILASSGIVTWVSFALSEAIRLTEEELDRREAAAGKGTRSTTTTVYVFDEPEAHLHPLAQEEVANLVAERVRAGAHVLLATHAIPFLRLPLADVEYVKVTRSENWQTTVRPMTGGVLGAVAESAEVLGLPPVALIQLTRGWLVVEGEHDCEILSAFHGSELRQAGIQILPLRGAARAKASFLNLAALAPLGLPFFTLLDNARAEAVKAGRIEDDGKTEEEKIVAQLWRIYQNEGVRGDIFGLPYPDIICALPFEVVWQVACGTGDGPDGVSSWSDVRARYGEERAIATADGRKTPNFKTFALERLGLKNLRADEFVREVLARAEGEPRDPELSRIVSEVLAKVDGCPDGALRGNGPSEAEDI